MYTITRPAAKSDLAKMAVKTSFVYAVAVIVFTCVYTVYGQQGATPAPCTTSDYRDYQCNDGNGCYSDWSKCDSYNTCTDKSDDLNCDSCGSSGAFYCVLSRQCVSQSLLCDGNPDCLNGEDEDVTFCSTRCTSGYGDYRCTDGNGCYSDHDKCDSYNDCNDKTDQLNCDSCDGAFYCLSSRQCVPLYTVCDGHQDCLNGEDEHLPDHSGGSNFAFYCPLSGRCVPGRSVCDGYQDCLQGEDENLPECNPTIWIFWSGGQIAGIVIGYVIFLVIVIAIVVAVHKNCKK